MKQRRLELIVFRDVTSRRGKRLWLWRFIKQPIVRLTLGSLRWKDTLLEVRAHMFSRTCAWCRQRSVLRRLLVFVGQEGIIRGVVQDLLRTSSVSGHENWESIPSC